MPAAITDKVRKTFNSANPNVARVNTTRTTGATTLVCNDLTGWPTDTAVDFSTYQVSATGTVVAGTQIDWVGIVSGNSLLNITRKAGAADSGNAINDYVEMNPTASWANDLATNILTHANQDGTLKTNSVATTNITDSNVTTAKIADSAVTTAKIADDAVTAAKIDWASTGANAGIWWEELGRTTLSVAGDTISVASLPARKYLLIICNIVNSGSVNGQLRFNGDTANNYAERYSSNGAAESTAISQNKLTIQGSSTVPFTFTTDVLNVSSQEKVTYTTKVTPDVAGATNIPNRLEHAGKWTNTSVQISQVEVFNSSTGDYAIGSELIVLGHN